MVRRKHIRSLVDKLLADHRVRSAPVPVEDIAKSLGAGSSDAAGSRRFIRILVPGPKAETSCNRCELTALREPAEFYNCT